MDGGSGKTGRVNFALELIQRIHFHQDKAKHVKFAVRAHALPFCH